MVGEDSFLGRKPGDQVRRLEGAGEFSAEAVDREDDSLDGGIAHGAENLRLQSLIGCPTGIGPDIGALVHERALDRNEGNPRRRSQMAAGRYRPASGRPCRRSPATPPQWRCSSRL